MAPVFGTWFGLAAGGGGLLVCGTPLIPPGLVVPGPVPLIVDGTPPGLAAAALPAPAVPGEPCCASADVASEMTKAAIAT